ncbi:aminoacyl-histidine dipeptidase [Bacteroidales bacterium OttesenSCG-928-M06]|nr:aminoacyl-histidine dipeptidase [Bacteroidales bacterium OttesenSCG-928-M06]
MEIKDLRPSAIWNYFDQITRIPRPSRKEEKIVEYLLQFAQEHQLEVKTDEASNILIKKPATRGRENLQTVILQSHVDMVCEKNQDISFNFDTDPIQTVIDGDWVKTKGTTLGADDGIGVAATLAILASNEIEHGPLLALFTTDEETGLNGANTLSPDFLQGDILINLDNEDWGEFCIGCAGGKNTLGTFSYQPTNPPKNHFWFDISISGLKGGHSGSDIHKELGNANKILARYLFSLSKDAPIVLSKIDGGNLHNAIAREAHAIVGIPAAHKEKSIVLLNILQADLQEELPIEDKGVILNIQSADTPESCIDTTTGNKLIRTIYGLPHGVIGWSFDMPGTVETSTNLASVKMIEGDKILITTSQRSSTNSAKENISNMVAAIFQLAGAEVKSTDGYPGWKPNPDSSILHTTERVYEAITNKKPRIISIHAGLECGLFIEKNPLLDAISCGPTITGAHSPDESLQISTVDLWWNFLISLLKEIPTK